MAIVRKPDDYEAVTYRDKQERTALYKELQRGRTLGQKYKSSTPFSDVNITMPKPAAEAPKNKAPSMASRVAGAKHGFSYGMERGAQDVLGVAEGVTDFIVTPVYNTVSAVTSLGGLAKNPVSNFFSQQAQNLLTESPTRVYGESIERRYNPDKGMRFAGDIVETVSGMLPAIGAGVGAGAAAKGITEGAKLAAKVAPHIGKAIMGIQAAGGGAQEAYQEGAGMGKSVVYGLGKGVLETATESIAGAIPGMPKGYISEITEKVVASPLARSLIDIAGEGGEEALSEILTPFLKRAVYAPYAKTASVDEIANAALMGMIAAGVIQGGTGNIDLRLTDKPPQTAANAPTAAADTTAQQQVHAPMEAQGEDLQAAGAQTAQGNIQAPFDAPRKVGRATTIKSPYMGETPTYDTKTVRTVPNVSESSLHTAQEQIAIAQQRATAEGKSPRNFLTDFYNSMFDRDGGARGIQVDGVSYGGKGYVVTVNKNAIDKVISDKNLKTEKLAILDTLDDVIENGEYVGSGNYIPHGSKAKETIRFDYFETPVIIGNKEYIAAFDVEVFPGRNNYRTHKVINRMDLIPASSGEVGPVPTAQEAISSPSNTNIPQGKNGVNTQYMQDGVNNAAPVPPLDTSTVSAGKTTSNLNFVNQDVMNAADTIGQTVKQTARTAYQQVVSGQAPIERLSKANAADNPDIDAATQMARQAGGIVDSIAEDALVSKDFKKIGISYTKLMKKIPKENLAEFNDYAQNLHNINRMSLEDNAIQAVNQFELSHPQVVGTPINTLEEMAKSNDDSAVLAREYLHLITKAKETKNKPVFGELIERITPSGKVVQELGGRTAEQSRQIVKDYEAAHPEYREIMNEIEAWWDKFGQSWYVDTGLVSKKSYDAMREMYPNYIPTHREEKQNTFGRGLFGKSVSTPKVVGAATGGAGKIIPLEESFMAQIDRTVRAAQRNELYRTLLKAAETDPKTAALHGVAISKKSGGTFDTADIDGFLDQVEQQTIKQLESGGFEVTVLVDGEKVTLDVSKEVGECLRWLEDKGMSESWLKNFIGLGKSLTSPSKAAITGINALFAITNTVKDSQTYFINSISNNPLELVSNYGIAVLNVAFKTKTYQTYKATGGARSGFYGQQRGFKKSLKTPFSELTPPKKIERFATTLIAAPFKAAAKVGEFTEQIPRVAEFRNAITRYGNTPEGLKRAAFAAADVTTNFSRGAPITKAADAWVMYLNAQVQGLDKTARQIKNRPIATLSKASVLSIATLLLALVNRDNPNYDELDNRTKDTYFLLPNEKNLDENGYAKTFYKIPKSREWGAIMSSSFDRIAKYMETQDLAESFRGYGSTFANNLLPSNPITDNILSPVLINLKSNRDFAGRNIVPQSMQNLSPRNQYDITTSGIARAVGERFNLSPKQIDYLIGSYMGYPGTIIQALSSPKNIGRTPEETAMNAIQMAIVQPFERRFTADPLYNSVTIDKLYYAIEQATTDAADKNFEENIPQDVVTPEDKRKSYLTKAAVDIAELRTEEKNILAEFLPIKEKEQKIDEIRRKMNNIAKEAITTVDDYVSAYEKTYVPETSMLGEKMQAAYRDMQNLITPQQFADVYNAQKGIKGDKDRHGKTIYLSSSKKKKAAIDTAARGLPKYVKYDLYDAFGVSEEIW